MVRLRTPPTQDKECPVTAGMGLDMFELHPSELQMDKDVIGRGQFGVSFRKDFCRKSSFICRDIDLSVANLCHICNFVECYEHRDSISSVLLLSREDHISVVMTL